jgi:AraC family transcriptional regulator
VTVTSERSLLWTSGGQWRGVVAELHRFEGLDTPEFAVSEHTIVIQRSAATPIELTADGRQRKHTVIPGDVALFPAGVSRRVRHGPLELLCITLSRELVAAAAETDRSKYHEIEMTHALRDATILGFATAFEAETHAGFPSGQVYGEALGLALAAHVLSRYSIRAASHERPSGGLAPCSLRRVVEYIDTHLADEVRLDELARVAGLSPHRFAHNFKRATGTPPYQFVIKRRIERAKPLLRDTEMTVTDVTFALGFGNPSRFTQLFRRATGTTPSRYRAAFR